MGSRREMARGKGQTRVAGGSGSRWAAIGIAVCHLQRQMKKVLAAAATAVAASTGKKLGVSCRKEMMDSPKGMLEK